MKIKLLFFSLFVLFTVIAFVLNRWLDFGVTFVASVIWGIEVYSGIKRVSKP